MHRVSERMAEQRGERMKAWVVKDKFAELCVVAFAPTASKAKSTASFEFEDSEYIDLQAHRLPEADSYYSGNEEPYCLDWLDHDDRLFLVKECGFRCEDFLWECCEECKANKYCDEYQQWLNDRERYNNAQLEVIETEGTI